MTARQRRRLRLGRWAGGREAGRGGERKRKERGRVTGAVPRPPEVPAPLRGARPAGHPRPTRRPRSAPWPRPRPWPRAARAPPSPHARPRPPPPRPLQAGPGLRAGGGTGRSRRGPHPGEAGRRRPGPGPRGAGRGHPEPTATPGRPPPPPSSGGPLRLALFSNLYPPPLILIPKEIGLSSSLSVGNYNPGQRKRKRSSMINTISVRTAFCASCPTDRIGAGGGGRWSKEAWKMSRVFLVLFAHGWLVLLVFRAGAVASRARTRLLSPRW
nr:proline-rich protein 2-like [Equus asinus]